MWNCPKCPGVRRGLSVFTGMVECLCFAGILFGWASLVFILKTQGFFGSFCVNATGINSSQVLDCRGQDEQFSLVFTIASFMNYFVTLLNGFIFDRFGTTVARVYAICLHLMGTLMVAFSTPARAALLFPALSFIAVGGSMLLLTNFQVANLFPNNRSTVITLLNGAFGSSAVVFLIVKLVFEAGISHRASFLFLSACSIIHVLRTVFLLPRHIIPYPLPDHYTFGLTCGKSKKSEESVTFDPQTTDEVQHVNKEPATPEKTFRECVLSRFFLFSVIWLSVIQLRNLQFIGTLNPTLQRLTNGDSSLVSKYTNAFAFTQLCAVLCGPWNGLILDRHKRKPRVEGMSDKEADLRSTVLSLFLTALFSLVFSICATIPVLPLQYFTFVMAVINRAFLYGGLAAFVSVAFPPCHFGKLYGLVLCLGAIFSLLQYACFALVESVLEGDPLYVNIALTLLILFSFIHPLFVFLHCRNLQSQRVKDLEQQ
ncbi:equilibrative nucleobase transporter 1-like isoform X1 [Nerophis ophidion]|uniref:equilibrative nucleobase transporter 1-like isoform X1 n=1 Tax=Nerophis ophidion TaxID=159077 RepID=UPI002AE019CD|nr:equilibrative nucleobase transporter 1-like isoform X1 [Nerophis ophidion]XP_061756094.1 equilibrative nucleobase transporter 1-like isoform X1 [Nerophis ophidion]